MTRHAALPVLAVILLAACSGQQPSPTDAPSQADASSAAPSVASSAASVAPSVEPSIEASPSQAASEPRQFGSIVPFTITVPADWELGDGSGEGLLWIDAGPTRDFAVSTLGPETVDEWRQLLTATDQLTVVAGPEDVEVGGASGFVVDVATNEQTGQRGCSIFVGPMDCYILVRGEETLFIVVQNSLTRAWVLDVDGETVFIGTQASESTMDTWGARVEEVLATLTWD